MYAAEKTFPHIEKMIYVAEMSVVDLVFTALTTCGSAHNAKNTAPRIPKQIE